ncbi:MAG TPA: hypothetical protein VJ809_02875, partial [Pirellulales bacterium]|nr:hypothetical protein [Pirellulales bacterium]
MVLVESATTLHALLGDHLNTVRDVTAPNGTMENHLVYNSCGDAKPQTPLKGEEFKLAGNPP